MLKATRYLSLTTALLAVTGLLSVPQIAEAATVSGSIKISGTKLKTEGGKSDKDVIIYLERADGGDYPAPSTDPVLIDQVSSVFIPHVVAIQKGTTVTFLNSDSFEHNVFSADECCEMDMGNFAGGAQASRLFEKPGVGVMLCKLHPEMAAYIVILETSFFTTAEISGEPQSASYRIENVPPGNYILKAWNKKTETEEQALTITEGSDVEADVTLQKKQRRRRKRK